MSKNALETSRSIITTILDDVCATYTMTGGGGISDINQDSTFSYSVHLPQEGRVDIITYTVQINEAGEVTIADKTFSTKSY